MKSFLKLLLVLSLGQSYSLLLYQSEGIAKIGYLIHQCNYDHQNVVKSLIHSAIWLERRINDLENFKIASNKNSNDNINKNDKRNNQTILGLEIHRVCNKDDYLKTIFDLHLYDKTGKGNETDTRLLGVIVDKERFDILEDLQIVRDFCHLLDVRIQIVRNGVFNQILASAKTVEALNLTDLYAIAPSQEILKEFYKLTRRDWICVKNFEIYNSNLSNSFEFYNSSRPTVIFGKGSAISNILDKIMKSDPPQSSVLVPLDGNEIIGPPENALILEPLYSDLNEDNYNEDQIKLLPSPLVLELANHFLKFTSNLLESDCFAKNNCIKEEANFKDEDFNNHEILSTLKIEPLSHEFIYNIINLENSTKNIVFTYSILDRTLNTTNLENFSSKLHPNATIPRNCVKEFETCILECENFKSFEITKLFMEPLNGNAIRLRQEPWVYAFISISTFGIIFCVAILAYITSRLCKKQVLEGNPILTILLLLNDIIIYLSIIPFILESDTSFNGTLHKARAIFTTAPYTFAFALLLSRTILLATVSKEVGFMSHVAGSVQGFLALFIFAVQAAFTLQLFGENGDCHFTHQNSHTIIYLMAYNVMLLVLLVFVTPLTSRSQRNYREGKHFTISIVLMAVFWSTWLPGYAVLGESWKDPLLCFGLVSTGSILLGCIFIPRTYMMTVSAARDRFTSALPSLATATSAMDIYRASTQPVYDCVNVAAVTAANLRAEHERQQQQLHINYQQRHLDSRMGHHNDYYSNSTIADHLSNDVGDSVEAEDEFDVTNCESPPNDKITRF